MTSSEADSRIDGYPSFRGIGTVSGSGDDGATSDSADLKKRESTPAETSDDEGRIHWRMSTEEAVPTRFFFFSNGEEVETASSRLFSIDDKDVYGQQQQAPEKCQLRDSGIGRVSCSLLDEVGGNSTTKTTIRNSSQPKDSFFFDGNGARATNRILTATAPPHLRSYYSHEYLGASSTERRDSLNDDNLSKFSRTKDKIMNDNVGIENRLKTFWSTINKTSNANGALASTSSSSTSNFYFPRARFDNGGDIENSNFDSFPGYRRSTENRPPPPPYNVAVGNRPNAAANGQRTKPSGQAPTIVTGATNRGSDYGEDKISTLNNDGSEKRTRRRIENRRNMNESTAAATSVTPSNVFNYGDRFEFPSGGGQSMQRGGSVENVENLSGQISSSSIKYWPSTPCIANAVGKNNDNAFFQKSPIAVSTVGAYCVQTATTTTTSSHSVQPTRGVVSTYINLLPEIRENVAVISLPNTPTGNDESSPYLLPCIVSSDRRSSLFSSPWAASVRTGAVSRMIKAVSCDSSPVDFDEARDRSPKDVDYLSNLRRVTKLAEQFESGDVDHVGPLKLYHAQVYKRELEKICAENFGGVVTKAQCYENGVIASAPTPTQTNSDVRQRSSFSSSSFSDDAWSKTTGSGASTRFANGNDVSRISGISSTKTTFPTTSEPNLNAVFAEVKDFTLKDNRNEDRRSRRTSYVMATSRNVAAATTTTAAAADQLVGGHQQSAYPVSEDANGARHDDQRVDDENTRQDKRLDISRAPPPLSSRGEAPRLQRLQIPEQMERKNSSGSSVSVTPTPTPSPTSGAKHARIQRFINFFSGDHLSLTRYSDGCVAGPGSSTSLSSCYTGASNNSSNQAGVVGVVVDQRKRTAAINNLPSPPTIEGPLSHKQLASQSGGGRKRSTDRNWKDYWAVLRGTLLYLCRERPATRYRSETAIVDETSTCYGLPEDALCIDVESCIADIAYDYVKRKHVFRVTTQRQTEHLFQAHDSQNMIRWIESLQRCSPHENQLDGISNSMALIIKRYEAQSQSVSPSVKQRRSAGVGGGGSKSPAAVPNGQLENMLGGGRCDSDGARFFSAAAAVSPNRMHAGVNSNSNDKVERMEKGDHTPGKARKWRRVRKSGSCPVPSPRPSESGSNPDAMFGARLEDCPTSGEDDFVPLIVQLCVKVVESQGLEAVGVYRIPGNTAAVNSLIATLDKGFENANFNDSRWRDVNVVSSLLKAYFRKLPDPLLTDQLYQQFIDASRTENHGQKLKKIRCLIERLPRGNYETLKYLLFHLRRIVLHSGINKMEARNLALMFGPSLVRPCGDSSMTTMVTHMSDQCKIVELLITYCDWIFSPVGINDEVPCTPPVIAGATDIANTSFADMTDLLRRVKTTEEELERTKESIVKSILNVRRGSRKTSKGKLASPESAASVESSSLTPQAPSFQSFSGSSTKSAGVNGHHHHHNFPPHHEPVSRDNVKAASASPSLFNERNIDEEIESRQHQQQQRAIVSQVSKGVSTDSKNRDYSYRDSPIQNNSPTKVDVGVVARSTDNGGDNSQQQQQGADEIRRRREDHIYAARRIFIVGAEGNDLLQRTPPVDTVAKMDLLAQHSRHLNVNPQSLDVLSPETREKIRRLQTDSQLLRSKGHWQTQQLKKVANERQRIELAWERAKQDYEQDDFLDDLADNPRGGLAVMTATSNPHLSVVSVDALSTSSDFSTTSSIMAAFDGGGGGGGGAMIDKRRQQHPLQKQQQKLMSISCTGALPLSDCSSDDPSPNSCHSPKSAQLHQQRGIIRTPPKSINRSALDQQQQSSQQPPTFCNVNQQEGSSPIQLYDRGRLKHVAPEVLFHNKSSPTIDEQRSSYAGSGSGGGGGGGGNGSGNGSETKYKNSPRHSALQKSKPWYDELADEENDVDSRMRNSVASSSENNNNHGGEIRKSAVDQNANNLTAKVPSIASASNSASGGVGGGEIEKRARILAPAERGASRISQKIKFRSKSTSAEKRKDNRRHTLTDMETLKNVLFGGGSSRENQHQHQNSVKEKPSSTAAAASVAVASNSASNSVGAKTASTNNKQSRTGKLKAWLKESFRKSSPDLYDVDTLDAADAAANANDAGSKAAI